MTTDDESSEFRSVHMSPSRLDTAIKRFHACKFGRKITQS
jgi:hypothetical protein